MRKKQSNYLILMATLQLSLISSNLFAADTTVPLEQKTYTLHTAAQSPIREIYDARIQEAFRRLNLNGKLFISPSSQRALMLANEDGDGDACRVSNIKDIAPQDTGNLIQVAEPVVSLVLSVYTKDLTFPVKGWESLTKYHNGARVGAKILEKNIPGKRTFLPTTAQLLQMLDSGRIDTMVEWDSLADYAINQLQITGIKKLSPSITVQPLHIYLHKRHQALAPKLSEALRQMKEDGSFETITKEFVFYTGAQSPKREILEGRLQEAFRRLGLRFRLVFPGSAQRSLVMANEEGDGDAHRVAKIKQIAPGNTDNLILIPESIAKIKFYVYSKGAVASVDGYSSLSPFRNGFRVGVKNLEKNVPGERVILPDANRLFRMLDSGRLDTVVAMDFIGRQVVKENNFTGITRLSPPLVDEPAYSLIHKKHQALVPAIVQVLQEMKTDGTFDKIEADVLKEFNLN